LSIIALGAKKGRGFPEIEKLRNYSDYLLGYILERGCDSDYNTSTGMSWKGKE